MSIKNAIRTTLNFLHLDLTKNLEYDRLTKIILKQEIKASSNCIDVGCHKGEILDSILKLSPKGRHFGFEPIPYLFNALKEKYNSKATIYPYALSDKNGTSTFNFVKNAPAYSGINKRNYDTANPDIEEIKVELKTLDELIPSDIKIDLIKIDVEGGEFGVLKGAKNLLKKDKPTIIFESGLGASDFYGTKPNELYDFITIEIGLKIYTLKSFINQHSPLTTKEFEECFNTNKEYYFVATK
ncbi:MAG: FkbM family methyltransferase [Bacteroidetes bacterium]|nr:FkbM family methyltransferase [Bacteroidota bacterium]